MSEKASLLMLDLLLSFKNFTLVLGYEKHHFLDLIIYITSFQITAKHSFFFAGWSSGSSLWSCGFPSENYLKILGALGGGETNQGGFCRIASHQRFSQNVIATTF